ncbi:MAG: hypothetical protein ACI4JA_06680 [Oscillospiraceae bacterium]
MILVILGICILATILSGIISDITDSDTAITFFYLSGLGFVISLIITIVLGVMVSLLSVIDSQIEMYQEENTQIEQQIANVVCQYQQYETEIFTTVAPEDSISLVALYPELKSDTLVQKQIDVYVANNEKIKALKEKQINGSVLRWWLYFGGDKND